MIINNPLSEVLQIANDKELAETGGAHNNKGVDFARHWAVLRMFELEQSGEDFLMLFEAIQDITEINSDSSPTSIRIYQIKKKERKEWGWNDLTGLEVPINSQGKPRTLKPADPTNIKKSPIGKLYSCTQAVDSLSSEAFFISNMGCDLPLANGNNAATSVGCELSSLAPAYLNQISDCFKIFHTAGLSLPDLSKVKIQKVDLPVNEQDTFLIGKVAKFLGDCSPKHAGQAESLVDFLIAKLSTLSRKTDSCASFEDLRKQRGFSRKELQNALTALESIHDVLVHLPKWLERLKAEGMDIIEATKIELKATAIYHRKMQNSQPDQDLIQACNNWLETHNYAGQLHSFFLEAYDDLKGSFPIFRKEEILAHFALRAIHRCVDQTLEN